MAAALAALKRYWGFNAFRPAQESVISAVLDGRDALVIMATGSGKSLWCAAARCSVPPQFWRERARGVPLMQCASARAPCAATSYPR
jgi:hypothetical protein